MSEMSDRLSEFGGLEGLARLGENFESIDVSRNEALVRRAFSEEVAGPHIEVARRVYDPLAMGNVVSFQAGGPNADLVEDLVSNGLLSRETADALANGERGHLLLGEMFARAVHLRELEAAKKTAPGGMTSSRYIEMMTEAISGHARKLGARADDGSLALASVLSEGSQGVLNNMQVGKAAEIPTLRKIGEAADVKMVEAGFDEAKSLLKHPTLKYGVLALGAAATLGYVRSHVRKDHTMDDIQGPPHLPGGNPYGTSLSEFRARDQSFSSGAGQGKSYYIEANGSFDPKSFDASVQAITGGPTRTRVRSGQNALQQRDADMQQLMNGYR